MTQTTVWAYRPIEELNYATGFVACEQDLATQLINARKVQDPRVGGRALLAIKPRRSRPSYQNKELTTKGAR
jgi:hypothetical protein